jgi:hypothetical protein
MTSSRSIYAYDKNTTIIGLAQTLGGIYAGLLIVYTHIPRCRSVYVFHILPCRLQCVF